MRTDNLEAVELVGSYARRAGSTVRIQLQLPDVGQLDAPELRLQRHGKDPVDCPADVSVKGPWSVVTASVDSGRLEPGTWRLALRPDVSGEFHRLAARLLVKDSQPIALLAGKAPRTVMPPPRPRSRANRKTEAFPASRPHRFLVKVADTALARLPEERAVRYRSTLGNLARRLKI